MSTPVEEQIAAALEVARQLARNGIPIFIAPPSTDPKDTSGFRLPSKWEQTVPDPAVLDRWQYGWAVCMVCGCGLDLVDLDLYAGGDPAALGTMMPISYGSAATASGGVHHFVRSMNVKSRNAVFPGIDIKAGTADGKSRGFAFIAPTVKTSKVTGQLTIYGWQALPDAAAARQAVNDSSGQALADLIRSGNLNGNGAASNANGTVHNGQNGHNGKLPNAASLMRRRAWNDIRATLASGRNNGVMRLAAALRGQGGWTLDAAMAYMYEHVWPLISQDGHEFPQQEFEATIQAQWRQYPDGFQQALQQAQDNAPGNFQQAQDNAPGNFQQGPPQAQDSTQAERWPVPGTALELTDAYLVDQVERWCLRGIFLWARGLSWLKWTGQVWAPIDAGVVHDAVRQWFRAWQAYAANPPPPQSGADATILGRMAGLLSKSRITAITDLAHGHPYIVKDANDFDAYPDVINTPGQIIDLRTGETYPNNPNWLLTKITSGRYVPGFTHADWDQALTALDPPERKWFQRRIGQAITGHPPSDGIMPVLQGSGENGKSACTTDGPVRALGDYAEMASHKLITSQSPGRSEHSTEMADLRGQRLLINEELSEGRSIDVTALKRIMDVGRIRARYVHKDNITFTASHSLFVTTNYTPVINETDHGTWRRLALVKFRYTFRKNAEEVIRDTDRLGDPAIKQRIKQNPGGQHDAIVTWAIDGARQWYDEGYRDAPLTDQITADTLAWRMEADRILGFCTRYLVPEPSACVLATDVLEQFNVWLAQGGHTAWSRETFASRFAGHEWPSRHGVENQRTRALQGLVSWPALGGFCPPNGAPKQATVWTRIRPKTLAELEEFSECAASAEPLTNLSIGSHVEKFAGGSAQPAQAAEPPGTRAGCAEPPAPPSGPPPRPSPTPPLVTDGEWPSDPPNPGTSPRPEVPAPADGYPSEKKPRKTTKPKPPKREGPDPELAGAKLSLPAMVLRDGRVAPCTVEQAIALVRGQMAAAGALTVDVETTGYPIGHPDYALRTVQLGDENLAVDFDAADPAQRAAVAELLAAAPRLHAHSASADLVPLERIGLITEEAWHRMFDTVLQAKLADPQLSGSDADGLKQLAADVLGDAAVTPAAAEARKKLFTSGKWLMETDALTPLERSGWAQVDPACETMIRYAGSDVLDTAALPRVLPPVDAIVMERERAVQRICARVTHRGMRLDPDHVHALRDQHRAAKAELGQRISSQYGIENPGSPQQVAPVFAELGAMLPHTAPSMKFPQGQPSTKESTLEPIRQAGGPAGELAGIILDYRDHATALALILEPFGIQVDHGDGRVRPTIYTLGADTGRMTARRPNLQQLSREGGIRACITADPGMVIVSADFQAVELRTAAALAGDQNLYQMIMEGDRCRAQEQAAKAAGDAEAVKYWKQQASLYDLHWKIAKQVWGPEATKGDRYNAKRGVFGRLYGSGIPGIARTLGISEADAQAVAGTLDAMAPGVADWSARMRAYVKGGGTAVQAYSGRTIWLDKKYEHKGPNYWIQGTAREFLVDGLLKWEQTRWGDSVIVPVHDEVLAVVPGEDAEEATAALVECMSTQLSGMPIIAEPSEPSFFWQDAA